MAVCWVTSTCGKSGMCLDISKVLCRFITEPLSGLMAALFRGLSPTPALGACPGWLELFTHNLCHSKLTIFCEVKYIFKETSVFLFGMIILSTPESLSFKSYELMLLGVSEHSFFLCDAQCWDSGEGLLHGKMRMHWREQHCFQFL